MADSFLDFLFEGKPPKAVTTTGSTTTALPQWMQDYTKGILQRAAQEAGVPYQPYEGARIAKINPTQQGAFDLARSNIGSAMPGINQAKQIVGGMPGQSTLQQAVNYLPGSNQEYTGENVDKYMNPYVDNVINRSRDLALRTYNEDFKPGLEGQFVRAGGGYGSSAHLREANRGQRDILQNIQDTSNAQLADAYGTGANIFNQDQSRAGTLAQIAGSLGQTQAGTGLDQAKMLADLGMTEHQLGSQDAATLETIGDKEQGQTQANLDLAYKDFLEQQGFNKQQLAWLQDLAAGSTAGMPNTVAKSETGPADKYQPSGLSQLASIIGMWKGIENPKSTIATGP